MLAAMSIPVLEPTAVYAGDTVTWRKALQAYPASEGWQLTYALRGPASINITAAADGDLHLIDEDPATTAGWAPGFYSWTAQVSKSGQKFTVATGSIEIEPNPTNVIAGTDQRPHCKKVLDAIEAVLEGRATRDQQEYQIDGLAIKRTPIPELLQLRLAYRREYRAWQKAQALKQGRKTGRQVKVRF